MHFLFDNTGRHIATLVHRRLYNLRGRNVGHYLPQYGVVIDRRGYYLGEIVARDRLLYNRASPHRSAFFGRPESYRERVGSLGNPEPRAPIRLPLTYEGIDPAKFER